MREIFDLKTEGNNTQITVRAHTLLHALTHAFASTAIEDSTVLHTDTVIQLR